MEKKCENCGNLFSKQPSDSRKYWDIKRFCSIKCSNTLFRKGHSPTKEQLEYLKSRLADKGTRWTGGRHITAQGYVAIYVGRRKYQLEHRYIMEQHLGRKLDRKEHVHHKNHDKIDNRIENLEVIGIREHGSMHSIERWHGGVV